MLFYPIDFYKMAPATATIINGDNVNHISPSQNSVVKIELELMSDMSQTNLTFPDVYSVSRLLRETRAVLEGSFPLLWVEGEISNLSRPGSGHLYFTLKDEAAQVRCAMFRGRGQHLGFRPENGAHVRVRARISLYEARGDLQLIVEHMEDAGLGALQRAFELLKHKLAAEGLFDAARKRELPALPRRIGVVTSPTGAAIRDILSVLRRRFPAIDVLIYPVPVQGEGAATEIAATLRLASQRRDCDVLILARGGGSLEDLWAFNEEIVARAVHASEIPVVTGIGHEIDFTIADFVADRRAPTPSVAAEMVSPDRYEWLAMLSRHARRLATRMRQTLAHAHQTFSWCEQRLQRQHPGQRLQNQNQRLDELDQRLQRAMQHGLRHTRMHLHALTVRMQQHAPLTRVQLAAQHLDHLRHRLTHATSSRLVHHRQHLLTLSRTLDSISPLATLGRGYAIAQRASDGTVVRRIADAPLGSQLHIRLTDGQLRCTVDGHVIQE